MDNDVLECYQSLSELARIVASTGGKSVLVVGCHDPRPAVYLASKGFAVSLTDPSRENVVYASGVFTAAKLPHGHRIAPFDALPFPDFGLDAVAAYSPFHDATLRQAETVLRECTRVMRMGAVFTGFFRAPRLGRRCGDQKMTDPHCFEEDALRALLGGMKVKRIERAAQSDRHRILHNDHGHWDVLAVRS